MDFIDYIARTNLFNFVIFAGIIIYLVVKLRVGSKIEDAKVSVDETIMASESAKVESEKKLEDIQDSMAHLEEDIDAIIEESEDRAKLVGANILEDAAKGVQTVKENAQKALENSKSILRNDLIRRASLASIEVAKARIIEELGHNAELHQKLIDESIEKLEGVEL